MKVDPSGLAAAAQRIMAALAGLTGGDPVHPPLAADGISAGAATRLSAAGTALAAAIGAQAAALAATAERMAASAAGFAEQEALNTAGVEKLAAPAAAATAAGFAPPAPPTPADVRPPLAPPAPLPGEVIAAALNAGTPGAGESFIANWSRVADATADAADLLRRTADGLPDVWDSPVATPVVRAHLIGYAEEFGRSASRARAIAKQAGQHNEQHARAAADVPPPAQFQAVQRQLTQVSQANAQSGGKLSGAVAALAAQKAALENQAQQVYSAYHANTEATTAPDPAGAGGPPGDGTVGDPPAVGAGAGNPAQAGQLSAMLPGMIPTVLGAAGGLVGGAAASIGKIPETLAQAGAQMAGAATQGLSGLMGAGADHGGPHSPTTDSPSHNETGAGAGGGGGGDTTPASGGPTRLPPVVPTTGAAPTIPSTPAGGASAGGETSGAATGMVPMGMPMGAMMPPGGGAGSGVEKTARPKRLVIPETPHTESVTGKVTQDRIAMSATARDARPEPPDDDRQPPRRPIVRRVTTPEDGS